MTGRRGRDGESDRPRVRGAWETPAVVVRGPDGSVVDRGAARRDRPHPRRNPGAVGAVLLRPTLTDAGDDREQRRRQRATAATVTALPPRPAPAAGGGSATGRRVSATRASRGPSSRHPGDRRAERVRRALARLDVSRLLPDDDEARARRALRLRRTGAGLSLAAAGVLVLFGVFPVRTWINQRAAEERARERAEVFERENDVLEQEIRDLGRDERIEEEARELGYVQPGEESYGVLPAPEAPAGGAGATSTTSTTGPPGD